MLVGGIEGFRDGVGKEVRFFYFIGLMFDNKRKVIYVIDQVSYLYIVCFKKIVSWKVIVGFIMLVKIVNKIEFCVQRVQGED